MQYGSVCVMEPANFKTLRESLGISPEGIGKIFGVSKRTVCRIETPDNKKPIPAAAIHAITSVDETVEKVIQKAVSVASETNRDFVWLLRPLEGHVNLVHKDLEVFSEAVNTERFVSAFLRRLQIALEAKGIRSEIDWRSPKEKFFVGIGDREHLMPVIF